MTDPNLIPASLVGPTAGESTCPICEHTWTVTPLNDCSLPVCGCYGHDTSADNPNPCGVRHAMRCGQMPGRGDRG